MAKVFYFLLFILLLNIWSCGDSPNNEKNPLLENTRVYALDQESTSFRFPSTFFRSSKYRIGEDLPWLRNDSLGLRQVQNMLDGFEFDDAETDVFIDSTSFHILIIQNLRRTPFDKQSGNLFAAIVADRYDKQNRENGTLFAEKVEATINGGEHWKALKFKYKIERLIYPHDSFYETTYFLTAKIQSYVIREFYFKGNDISAYLGTIKE